MTVSGIILTYLYILYLSCKDAILAILYTGLPITISIVGKWLNNLIFCDDNVCIAANGHTIIYIDVNELCHMMDYSFHTQIL